MCFEIWKFNFWNWFVLVARRLNIFWASNSIEIRMPFKYSNAMIDRHSFDVNIYQLIARRFEYIEMKLWTLNNRLRKCSVVCYYNIIYILKYNRFELVIVWLVCRWHMQVCCEYFAGCMESCVWTVWKHSTFESIWIEPTKRRDEEVKNGDANLLLIRVAISFAMKMHWFENISFTIILLHTFMFIQYDSSMKSWKTNQRTNRK